jgi:hypothetical protein
MSMTGNLGLEYFGSFVLLIVGLFVEVYTPV